MPPIRLTNSRLQDFYARNPQFQVQSFDFNNAAALGQLAWDSSNGEEVLSLLKSYQRLLKLYPDERAADALLARGFTSARQIARVPEARFVSELGPELDALDGGDGARLAHSIHRNARAVQTGARLLSLDAQAASLVASVPPLAHLKDSVPFEEGTPSYERLFGRNVYAVDKDAQTIFSPAAYFVDLMNLIDEYITQPNAGSIPLGLTLQERRPDLWQIKLDSDSTYTELPYIEIVNQILESKLKHDLGEDPRKYVANAVYPFALPANLPLEEVRAYLAPFKLTLAEIFQAYRAPEQQKVRESLGLSLESYGLISGNPSALPDGAKKPTVEDAYGLYESQTTAELSSQRFFLEKTGLTSQQLNELLYQDMRRAPNYVLSFDGVDDFGWCESSDSLQVIGDQTIEMWLKADSLATAPLFWKGYSGEFGVSAENAVLWYTCGNSGSDIKSSNNELFSLSPGPVPLHEWLHLAVVRDWAGKQVRSYINGVEQSSCTKSITLDEIGASNAPVYIGHGFAGYYHGQLSEVRLWNVVRSEEEIQADMRRRLTGSESGLAGYWPMDEGCGATLFDHSPNKNTVTIYSNPNWKRVNDLPVQDNQSNSALLHGLFINSKLDDGQYLFLAEPDRIQVTDGTSTPSQPDDATLDRLQRFIRLAAQLGWSYADLDWTLRSLGATTIDDAALSGVALVKELQAQLQQPLDVLCSFWADVKTIGQGAQAGPPQDLFDRVFNLPDAFYSPAARRPSPPYHPAYSDNPLYLDTVQSWHVDSDSLHSTYASDTQFRSRLMAALQLNDAGLTALAHYLCDRGLLSPADLNGAAQDDAGHVIALTVQNLSLLYRYSKLAQLLKLSMGDFLTLLPLVGQVAIVKVQDVLKVCGWARWLKAAGLSVAQLRYITTGTPPKAVSREALQQAAGGMMNTLAASSQGALVTPAALMTGGMSQSQAQKLFDNLVAQGFINAGGLVLHERQLSPESLSASVTALIDRPPHETGPVIPPRREAHQAPRPSAQDVEGNFATHVSEVLRAYLARQNELVVKTLANGLRATPAQVGSAALLTEVMRPTCLTFDGTDDYCEVGYSPALNPAAFTVSCWIRVAAQTAGTQSVITSRDSAYDLSQKPQNGYLIYVEPRDDATGQGFSFWVGNGTNNWEHLTDVTPITDQWTHIAVTYDGDNMLLYFNGKKSSGPTQAVYAPNASKTLRIGAGHTESYPMYFFGGEISDLRLWNTALSAEQIQAEMYSREPRNTESLAAWWPIKAGSGTTLYDWSLNGHDGPLYEYANSTTTPLAAPDWNSYHLNQLLNPLQSRAEPPPAVLELLELTAQNLTLVKALGLTPAEVAGLVENPAPFGIEGIVPGFAFTPQQVRNVWEFKRLCKAFGDASGRLLAYFAKPSSEALAQLTGWDETQIETLESYLGGLSADDLTVFGTVAGVAALKRCFDVSLTLGVSVDYVLNTLLPLNALPVLGGDEDNWAVYENAAASVKQVLQKHYKPDLLKAALGSIQGPLQERLRDRLSGLLIWELGRTFSGIKTEQDLYEYLLTDVGTSSVVQLSYLKEGLNALQLYVQRCMTNLESGVTDTIPREWWAWMDSYRVWQANREVFLYPENYFDPTLRKLQSPQFKDFSTQLMQGQLTEKLISASYASYMDAAQELAGLRIVESYAVTQQDGRKLLHLFGCTRTEPPTFYMRTTLVNEAAEGVSVPAWTPWEQIDLNIHADYVTPVYAYNRLFLFWVEQSQQGNNSASGSGDSAKFTTARIKYSFRKMGWGWIQPQTLRDKIVISAEPATSYQQSVCPAVSFDPDSPGWQKVTALIVPPSGARPDEELLIAYGPLMRNNTGQPPEPGKSDSLLLDAFNTMLYRASKTAFENKTQYVPVGPTTILTSNLVRRSTQLVVGSDGQTWSGYVAREEGASSTLAYAKVDLLSSLFEVETFPPGLLNYWPINEGPGSSDIHDKVGGLTLSPLSNSSSTTPVLTWHTVPGNPFDPQRYFLYFGGSTYLLSSSLALPNNYSEITIEAWVNVTNVNQSNDQFVVSILDDSGEVGYRVFVGGGNLVGLILLQPTLYNVGGGRVDSAEWVHVALTAKSNGMACMYVNGQQAQLSFSGLSLPESGSGQNLKHVYISSNYSTNSVTGYISEVRLWDVQLSGEQIAELYRTPGVPSAFRPFSLGIEQSIALLTASVSRAATARPVGNQPGWFIFDNTDEVFLVTPQQASLPSVNSLASFEGSTPELVKLSFGDPGINTTNLKLNFTRLSTHGFLTLSRLLLSGGVRAMLSLPAQQAPELPFSRFKPTSSVVSNTVPATIDFYGAYGDYYWEIFFHMPLLVGDGFNARQQFSDAKRWYEFIFDPTAQGSPGLVSYWPLNGTPQDVAGRNDLSASGDIDWVPDSLPGGKKRSVLSLNGQGGQSYLYCPNNTSLQITGNQTIEMWLKPTAKVNSNPFAKSYNAEGDLWLYLTNTTNQSRTLDYRYGNKGESELATDPKMGTDWWSFQVTGEFALGEWVHVAVVRDVTNGQIRAYVNGQQQTVQPSSVDFTRQPVVSSSDELRIGYGLNGYFQGELAEVALWRVALTSEEVFATYANRLGRLQNRFWRFEPFGQLQRQSLYQYLTDPTQIKIYEYDPFDPDALAHQRQGAYEKAVVQKYVNNLINYGDYLFTQDTWETLTEAQMYYVLAGDLLGKPPKVVVSGQGQDAATYQQLAAADAEASPFVVELEFQVDDPAFAAPPQVPELLQNWRTLYDAYFKVPVNSQLFGYYKTIADRLYKIRNGLNIDGQPVQPPLYEPPIDPETLVTGGAQSWAGNGGSSPVAAAAAVPVYRFSYLIQQARGLASETASLGASLLAALEKQDAEQLALLQATQQNNIFNLMTQLKQSQISQLQAVRESLQASLAGAQLQQSTYQQWYEGKLSALEIEAEAMLVGAMPFEAFAAVFESLASAAWMVLPDNFQLAEKVGSSLKAVSGLFALMGKVLELDSQLAAMQGQFERRSSDWNLQMQLAENSVSQINAQLQANQYELDSAQQDLVINQTNIGQSQQIVDFLHSKFTNEELYQWMAGQLSTLYYQTYQLACQVALQAQIAYQYEMCSSNTFVNTNAWNGQYRGLLAGESLLSNLDQMEQAYNNNTRKLEITKTVSLLRLAPQALLKLKRTGQCEFDLGELLFDLDYPGHYQRTIQTVSISIPAVVGPYQNVHATLTQLSNATVTTPNLGGVKYLLGLSDKANSSVRVNWNPSQEVALSSGIDDSGLFQLNFNDERYLPFEGTGAVSSWRLSMPKASNPFNFESISDVIINLKYSAYDGGQTFATSVLDLNDGKGFYPLRDYEGYKYLSLRQVYGDAWHAFLSGDGAVHTLNFMLAAEMFPVNLTGLKLGRGEDEQVILAPIFAPSIMDDIAGEMPDITLNDNPWNQGLVDAAPQSSDAGNGEGGDTFPLKWSIQATIATSSPPSPLLLPDGRINPALWQDIVLIIPYSGSLSW